MMFAEMMRELLVPIRGAEATRLTQFSSVIRPQRCQQPCRNKAAAGKQHTSSDTCLNFSEAHTAENNVINQQRVRVERLLTVSGATNQSNERKEASEIFTIFPHILISTRETLQQKDYTPVPQALYLVLWPCSSRVKTRTRMRMSPTRAMTSRNHHSS